MSEPLIIFFIFIAVVMAGFIGVFVELYAIKKQQQYLRKSFMHFYDELEKIHVEIAITNKYFLDLLAKKPKKKSE